MYCAGKQDGIRRSMNIATLANAEMLRSLYTCTMYFDGLAQNSNISIASALEIILFNKMEIILVEFSNLYSLLVD